MIFVAPWVLVGLLALPLLWWLLRVTPPAPRSEIFPAVRFLLGLNATEETPARTPWWLLALRLLAAGLVIVALARPVLDAGTALAGKGPVLLVMDNGWAAADDWVRRKEAAGALLDRAERAGRKAALLTTAPDGSGAPIAVSATMPIADLRARLAAMQPQPWPSDRAAAADAMRAWHDNADASVIYVPDGLTDGADFDRFAAAMRDVGPVTEICCDTASSPLLLPPTSEADRLVVHLAQAPRATATEASVLAQSGDGRTLARTDITVPAGRRRPPPAPIPLPPELRNRLTRLVLEGPPSAGSVVLLDERWRRRPVGLLSGDLSTADTPFTGSIYFLKRALEPFTELREGDAATLLKRDISVLVLADRPLPDGRGAGRAGGVGAQGRPADPLRRPAHGRGGDERHRHAAAGAAARRRPPAWRRDVLEPAGRAGAVPVGLAVRRPAGDRGDQGQPPGAGRTERRPGGPDLGGAGGRHAAGDRSAARAPAASCCSTSPPTPTGPTCRCPACSWTCCAGWWSCRSASPARRATPMLAPAETLDGFGLLSQPPPAAIGLQADKFGSTPVSPRHPPGLVWPGKRPAGAEPGHQHRGTGSRRRRSPARRWKPCADRRGSGRWGRRCWRSRCCCCASTC